ncbi:MULTISPECIES: TolC family protein [unclassified Ectothiorhodospira]|uniref:TolC family protein n=1 Tax=unclassified Ectothiorhodospira TaxID=2684909 RepID=UPI001EE896C5|nr:MULTISPECIES: TolC family protein [unclassified Ectothiorhodospira]MCG5516894.1 TolC family protein [Ectothiorhodospira sp. 9100]MCG5519856.1 TolC family protein [Ectothiorhodospira sp. 9905]
MCLALASPSVSADTLGQVISAALVRSGEQALSNSLRQQGDAVRRQSSGVLAADPSLNLNYISDQITDDEGFREIEATLELPLWWQGQRRARQGVAQALGDQADVLDLRQHWTMAGRVREQVWEVALTEATLQQMQLSLQTSRDLENKVARLVAVGELAQFDLLTIRQEVADREADVSDAQSAYRVALAGYRQLTGQTALPEPIYEPPVPATELPPNHPGIQQAQHALALAQAETIQARRSRAGTPILGVGGRNTREFSGANSHDAVQISLTLPFGLAGQSAPAIASAVRTQTEQDVALQQARLTTEQALISARLDHQGAEEALNLATRRQTLAQDALHMAQRAFDLGETDLVQLLRTQTLARSSALDLEQRRIELGRAQARLNQALGVIPK